MGARRIVAVGAVVAAIALSGVAHAQSHASISIEKHARLTADGAVVIRVHIACDPLPGTEDFQEALAGAGQARTGAEAEGGVDGTIVCDGIERTYTARLSPFSDAVFKRGQAGAGGSLLVCNVAGDDQVCEQGSTQRRIIIAGRLVP